MGDTDIPPLYDGAAGETWLNWRLAVDWELPAIARARQRERERDAEQVAGLIATGQDRPHAPSAASWLDGIVTDLL